MAEAQFNEKLESAILKRPKTLYKLAYDYPKKAEIIAKRIWDTRTADGKTVLDKIETITRKDSYKGKRDAASAADKAKLDRREHVQREKWIAKCLKDKKFRAVGKIIDYETPLKTPCPSEDENVGVGKIDLVAHDAKKKKVFLLELKTENNEEPLLRCALEIYTYWKQLNHVKFLKDFGIAPGTPIEPAILIFKNCCQHCEYKSKISKYTNELIKALKIKVYTIEPRFEITKGV